MGASEVKDTKAAVYTFLSTIRPVPSGGGLGGSNFGVSATTAGAGFSWGAASCCGARDAPPMEMLTCKFLQIEGAILT